MRLFPRELLEVSLQLHDGVLHRGVVGRGYGSQVSFETRDVSFELVVPERFELLVPVFDALHHGSAPANWQLQLYDLLQVSLVLRGWFGLLPPVSFDLDRRHL